MLNDAEEFLKQSMERHKALKTFQATVAWDLLFEREGKWSSSGSRPRTIAYAAPNRFRIQHGDARLNFLYICDGKEYVVRNSGFNQPTKTNPLPESLATSELVNDHPHFGASFLYAFFGGAQNLTTLLGKKNSQPIRFGEDITLQGELCQTVVFGGGSYYKERRAIVSVRDGLLRQVEGIDPGRTKDSEELEGSKQTLAQLKASPQWKTMPPEQQRDIERQLLNPNTPVSRTVETLSDLVVNQPIPDSTFAVTLLPAERAKQQEAEAQANRGIIQKPGDLAPDFNTTMLATGQSLRLSALKGKVVLIDLWATWCPPCVRGLPETLAIQKDYAKKGLVVLAVSDEKIKTVTAFLKAHPELKGLNVLLSEDADKLFGVQAIPTMVLVGRDGKILASFLGLQDPKTLRRALAEAGLR